jgi:uncharacterized protein YjbI with pentapeptide repeats
MAQPSHTSGGGRGARFQTARRLFGLIAGVCFLLGLFATLPLLAGGGAEPPKDGAAAKQSPIATLASDDDIAAVEDPVRLRNEGHAALAAGNKELAQKLFEASVDRDELNHYSKFAGKPLGNRVVQELMGDYETSRKGWEELVDKDVATAYREIAVFSRDPEKQKLLDKAKAKIEALAAQAKAGEKALIYVTKKGAKRFLTPMTQEEFDKEFEAGERVRYAYIEELNLTEKTYSKLVRCQRCLIGKVNAWGSTFDDQLKFDKTIVIGDLHLGKKWKGEVNKSSFITAGRFNTVYLDNTVVLGNLNLDSAEIYGRVFNAPLSYVEGTGDFRNARFRHTAEFRYAKFGGPINAKGAEFGGASYFGYTQVGGLDFSRVVVQKNPLYFNSAHFTGPVGLEKCELLRGATFENATFDEPVTLRQCRVYDRFNMSRTLAKKDLIVRQMQLTDFDFLGGRVLGNADFRDSVFTGNARFSLDGLTRRNHLKNVDPLHKLYKQYQGDDDAETDLTFKSAYGVVTVNDLTASFGGGVTFANTIYEKFVNFEGVQFGTEGEEGQASFYNAQFYGEAHFERTRFYSTADFRTIFGNEVSFNQANFYRSWIFDDANIPGRLSMNGADLAKGATLSFYGARVAGFGISFRQLKRPHGKHRLFYEHCVQAGDDIEKYIADPRLTDARWDAVKEVPIDDPAEQLQRGKRICMDRAVSEFVTLKDSFTKRSMAQEKDWAYWHLRHSKNKQSALVADSFVGKIPSYIFTVVFEMGFGWGVRLQNLLFTGMFVVLLFVMILWIAAGDTEIMWGGEAIKFRNLPLYAKILLSFQNFLGKPPIYWKAGSATKGYKILYMAELISGIILITFFIGAYTRIVLG